jgi:hypothetical protein
MVINNLSERESMIADLLWATDSAEDLSRLLRNLSREDRLRAMAITALACMGGDEVTSLDAAQAALGQFQL